MKRIISGVICSRLCDESLFNSQTVAVVHTVRVKMFHCFAGWVGILLVLTARAENSDLWGANGERWDSRSRLPDFSFAGYHCGEAALPNVPRGVSVKDFGAKGDGVSDDTAAFQKAIASAKGAIEIPPGRFVITDILEIKRSGVVLRGAGPNQTVLFFPKPLQAVHPLMSATTEGKPTSEYSWAGGFVWFKGATGGRLLTAISGEAQRGDKLVRVSSVEKLSVGQRVEILLTDNSSNTLANELYSGDPGKTDKLEGSTRASLVCHVVKISGNQIQIDRPLRFDIRPEWKPGVVGFEPTVSESGVENLCFEFPNTPYPGHFNESGFNAAAFSDVVNCWGRNLRITNADSGIFCNGRFCTIQGVVYESARQLDHGSTGHHGFDFEGEDNLLTEFDFRTEFVHDLTVDHCAAGNVFAHGKGVDLCFDHHKRTCYENLFTDIDAGAGTHLWRCGGGADLGKNCGARGTFWNIRAARPQKYPPAAFGPPSMNFIAVQSDSSSEKNLNGKWFEAIAPEKIQPQDLHAAQLARRLANLKN